MPLVVCPTPIGNLEDVTLRVLRELREANLVLCEDTRRTRTLLDRHGVRAKLLSYHRHNEAQRVEEVLPPLVASGLVGDRYSFAGYLPRQARALSRFWKETAAWEGPVVAFESPRRLPTSLASLATESPERPVAVCRELTKRFEEVVRGRAREVAEHFREAPKGEVTLVIGPAPGGGAGADEEASFAAVAELVAAGIPRRRAADLVAKLTGVRRNRLYRSSL